MIPFEQALEIALSAVHPMPQEQVHLSNALNRVLLQDIVSDVDVPGADVAAVDGFACRTDDRHGWMRLVETIPAGRAPFKTISYGECSKVMSGAIVPEGTECVAARACAEEKDGFVRIQRITDDLNIRRAGSEICREHTTLRAGALLTPPTIALLALAGVDPVLVACRPRVSVICTGDELVEPGLLPGQAQTRNCNGMVLCAQATQAGGVSAYRGIVRDTHESIHRALSFAIGVSDLVIFSGGVSQGEFDLVPDALRKAGVAVRFEGVAMYPGSGVLFGTHDDCSVFALPGDPVSSFISFEVLVRPVLMRAMGCVFTPSTIWSRLGTPLVRHHRGLLEFQPVVLGNDGHVRVPQTDSAGDIRALNMVDGVIALAPDADLPGVDDDVEVMLLQR